MNLKPHELIISNNHQRRIQALSILQHPSKHAMHQPKARLALTKYQTNVR